MRLVIKLMWVVLGIALAAFIGLLALGGYKGQGQNASTIQIAGTPEEIFGWITEPEKLQKWIEGLVESTPLTEGGLKVGARSREVMMAGDARTDREVEITALEQNERLEASITSEHFEIKARYILSVSGERTRLTYIGDIQFKGFLFKLFSPIIIPTAQKQLEENLSRLKEMVEAAG